MIYKVIFAHLLIVSLAKAAPSDIQPANQPPALPATSGSGSGSNAINAEQSIKQQASQANNNNVVGGGELQKPSQQQNAQMRSDAPIRLPNINIYINRNEIKKLLGIDSRINYVTNGNIDTYPFGFTIPLGYNQTDMIFTWQNLGSTNVNYSISLVIGNDQAVEMPLINITRSGLIPSHEQVFKITLPCSGKMSVEVDFQVLINVVGYVEAEPVLPPASASDEVSHDELAPLAGALAQVQADQAPEPTSRRLVSHTLTLNRKKICTIHPVPVPVQPPTRPPQQVQRISQQQQQQTAAQPATSAAPFWQPNQSPSSNVITNKEPTTSNRQQSIEQQAILFGYAEPAARNPFPALDADQSAYLDESTKMMANFLPATAPPSLRRDFLPPIKQQQAGAYANWPRAPNKMHVGKLAPSLIVGNDIAELTTGRALQQQPQQVSTGGASNSPLVFTLIGLSLLISVALIVVAILGSFSTSFSSSSSSSSTSSNVIKRSPLDKLTNFTSNLLPRRTPANVNKCSGVIKSSVVVGAGAGNVGPVISSFRAGPKSQASSMSGLSAISGGPFSSNAKSHAFYKTNACATTNNNTYYTTSQYLYPTGTNFTPTADLLGTNYQCQQQQQQQQHQIPVVPPPQYPIHQLAANNHQTTRLIWNNNANGSHDGFTVENSYMPLSNAPRSDSGSVYQTIY